MRLHGRDDLGGVAQQGGLGDLEVQPRRCDASDSRMTPLDELGVARPGEGDRRQVDRHGQRLGQPGQRGQAHAQHRPGRCRDQRAELGDGDEVRGRGDAAVGALDRGRGLVPGDSPGRQVHDRLEVGHGSGRPRAPRGSGARRRGDAGPGRPWTASANTYRSRPSAFAWPMAALASRTSCSAIDVRSPMAMPMLTVGSMTIVAEHDRCLGVGEEALGEARGLVAAGQVREDHEELDAGAAPDEVGLADRPRRCGWPGR